MPHRRGVQFDVHIENRLDNFEQSLQHFRLGKIFFYFLIGKRVARLAQFFAGVHGVPGFEFVQAQLLLRKGVQLGVVAPGKGLGPCGQIVQKVQYLFRAVGHLRHQGDLGKVRVAEQLRLFTAQDGDAVDQRRVVEFRIAEFRCARDVGLVDRFAQAAVIGILQYGQPRGRLQGQLPAGFAAA